ncbi:MAG: DUF1707 SHOCT-like domain-containing protein [Propionibacteriaceae bacterium]
MSNVEPSDVGPIVGGNLRVTQEDRNHVADLLQAAKYDGRLTDEELAHRLSLTFQAHTFDDLIPLTRDLVAFNRPPHQHVLATPNVAPTPQVDTTNPNASTDRITTILGNTDRNGNWRIHEKSSCLVVMGNQDLDMRKAIFEAKTCTLHIQVILGNIDIRVPEGVQVLNHMSNMLGDTEIRNIDTSNITGPTLILKGYSLLGSVSVKGPKPGVIKKTISALFGND